jgi:hypothetical protein
MRASNGSLRGWREGGGIRGELVRCRDVAGNHASDEHSLSRGAAEGNSDLGRVGLPGPVR